MALDKDGVKTLIRSLVAAHGQQNVVLVKQPGLLIIRVLFNTADRMTRIKELTRIHESLKPYGATYIRPSGGKTGSVKIGKVHIQCKPNEANMGTRIGSKGFKPTDIKPSIVNDWITADDIVRNVKMYMKTLDLAEETEREIVKLLDDTVKDTNATIPFETTKDLIPPEFFEILTAVKLAKLLSGNDKNIRRILGIPPRMDLNTSRIKIKIPMKSNFPLIDYYISITPTENKDEETALKISVKSKVRSASSNNVKFNSIFVNKYSVQRWYKRFNGSPKLKQEQKGPSIIAEAAMDAYTSSGSAGKIVAMVPLMALRDLIEKDKAKILSVMSKVFISGRGIDADVLVRVIELIIANRTKISYKTPLSDLVKDNKDLLRVSQMITDSTKTAAGDVEITVYNLAYMCEKILMASSTKGSPTSYNFYQMFFDEVLVRKHLAYAVAEIKTAGPKMLLHYGYYSLVNFEKEYGDYIKLKNKGAPNKPSDAIGLDI